MVSETRLLYKIDITGKPSLLPAYNAVFVVVVVVVCVCVCVCVCLCAIGITVTIGSRSFVPQGNNSATSSTVSSSLVAAIRRRP